MTLNDLRMLPRSRTRSIDASLRGSLETLGYIAECVNRFYNGDYGEVPQEDTDANNYDLIIGEGHILARYERMYNLEDDIYIEAYFSESAPGVESNNITVMYCRER